MNNRLFFTLLVAYVFSAVASAEMNVPIQLRLKSPGGAYPNETNLTFKLVILTPASGCILREEDFSSQTITNGNVSLNLGSGVRGISDLSLTLNQVYDNSKTKTGLTCVDASNNIVSTGQSYVPAGSDGRIIRVLTTIGGDPVLANFNMRATPYAIQAESVGGKSASDLIVKDVTSQMNQTNLNDLLLDLTRFNNLKNIALSGQANTAVTATSFSGSLTGDISGTQTATSVDRIKGITVSTIAPLVGQVLQYNGTQYVPATVAGATVISVAGKIGAVVLTSSDISGLGSASALNVGTAAGTVAAGDDSRIVNSFTDTAAATAANTASTLVKRDASGNISVSNVSSTNNSTNNLYLYDGLNSVRVKAPVGLPANYILTLPPDAGLSGQVLQTNGAGQLSWVAAAGGGTVTAVTASLPLASTGGVTPNLSISQASTSASGFLSSADWTTFNNKENALGFVPLNSASVATASCSPSQSLYWNSISSAFLCQNITFPADAVSSVAGRTGAVVLSNTDISGLGGAALLNVGAAAGTVAAGNDSRILGALQSSVFNGYVTSASCTSSQSLYWNSVSSQFLCQNITFPADAVSSVAGRIGAVSLASSDISGLGSAAGLNVGTVASTVAAGDDPRIVNALQTSSAFSGDVTGTSSTVSVDKIRGVAVSAVVPTSGQALVYNGTQWVPATGFPSFARKTANETFAVTALANVTSLSFAVVAGATYKYKFNVMYTSAATTTGLRLGLTYPAVTNASGFASIASGGDGTGAYYQGVINLSGDSVMSAASPSATATLYAQVEGIIVPSADGTVQLQAATEVAASNIVILAGSFVEVVIVL